MRKCAGMVLIVVVLSGGYLAQAQIREKAQESKKPGPPAPVTAPAPPKPALDRPAQGKPVEKPATNKPVPDKPVVKPPVDAPVAQDPDEKAIWESAEEFSRLYNAHDAKGLGALFSPKAEMIDEDDNVVKGREAIEKEFAAVFKEKPKAAIAVEVESIRVLTSTLAIEEGITRSQDDPDGPESVTTYVAIHVKIEGKWLLACVRDWEAPAAELTPHDRLAQELSWLVGEWVDESEESTVHTVCKWHDNGNFLMQEFQVNVRGDIAMSGTMRIGWNAVTKQFQSWVFDSHGGHSTGFWLRDGDRWIVKMQGATAAGEAGSSTNYYRQVDKDTLTWGSYDRVIDGERQDDIAEIVVKRRPPQPAEHHQ